IYGRISNRNNGSEQCGGEEVSRQDDRDCSCRGCGWSGGIGSQRGWRQLQFLRFTVITSSVDHFWDCNGRRAEVTCREKDLHASVAKLDVLYAGFSIFGNRGLRPRSIGVDQWSHSWIR